MTISAVDGVAATCRFRGGTLPSVLPSGVAVTVVFAESHALPALAIGGGAAVGGVAKGFTDFHHAVRMVDKGIAQTLSKFDDGPARTGEIRDAYGRAAVEVNGLEARVRGERLPSGAWRSFTRGPRARLGST